VSKTLTATVFLKPKAELFMTKSNDINCVLGETILSSSGGISYQWRPASTLATPLLSTTIAAPQVTTMYHLEVLANNGCVTKDSIQVLVEKVDASNGYQLPNAFTPNNDGLNDCFGIRKWGMVTDLEFSIFNRFGERVFYTTNPLNCWDGKYKGKLQETGQFVYTVKGKGNCGFIERKGTVLLIR
jgi:gliding motility-associated-like protein